MSQLQKSPDVGDATPVEIGPLKIGAVSGVIGLAYGGLKGTLRHAKRPAITALSQGIEAALLGAITWSRYLSPIYLVLMLITSQKFAIYTFKIFIHVIKLSPVAEHGPAQSLEVSAIPLQLSLLGAR